MYSIWKCWLFTISMVQYIGNKYLNRDTPSDENRELTHVGGLQPMNSFEWLEGHGGHEAFHHQQIDKMIAQIKEQNIK
jgi:hypothetical protein